MVVHDCSLCHLSVASEKAGIGIAEESVLLQHYSAVINYDHMRSMSTTLEVCFAPALAFRRKPVIEVADCCSLRINASLTIHPHPHLLNPMLCA
eukprot:234982-Amphidinium_carterae.1